ncbi:MAG TPA: FxSxx-COOH system tetratricopeptide repeat protein [Isosphaeraceae bacterium]
MPHARNAGFVGRERLLEQVRLALRPVADATRTVALTQVQAVHGLGGIGKTQVAIEFVHAHGAEFDAVFWVLANTPKRLASDFAELARVVGLPDATSTTDVNEQARAVRRWLESPESGRWLLVFDNVDEPEHLRGYLPTQPGGLVLTTSRRSHWPPGVRAFEVRELERPASVKLLLERSGQADAAAADRLAAALGDFPLALAQAAGYLAESGLALATYLDLYRERRAELLQKGDPPDGYTLTVFTTLDMAMSRINTPEAEELLGLIACLAPDAIPRSLLEAAFADPIRLADALAALGRHSLIAVGTEGVEAHRLVQAVAWDRMPPEAQSRHAARAVSLLEAAFPRECYEVRTWDVCKLLQPHAAHAARLAERGRSVPETIGKLLDRVGVFDEFRARSEDAEASFRQSLAVWEAAFGLEDPRVARTLTHLGRVLQDRGKLAEARRCLERALRIKEAAYGPDHPQVASTLGNLGNVAHAQGDLAEARRCQERALRIEETAYGPDHPEVASTLNNLGLVAQLQGDLAEARRCQERALRIK